MTSLTSNSGATPVDLNVVDSGGEGRPVVLIHGWPLSGESWAPTAPALTDAGYRVITYDRRGFGASSKPEDGYDYDTLTGDLDAVLTGLDVTDATLVGFSMGGGEVARYLGTKGSERVHSAVLIAAIPPDLLKTDDNPDGGLGQDDVEGMMQQARDDREGFLDGFATNFYTADDELKVDQDAIATWKRLAAPASDTALVQCINAFGTTDFRADLDKADVPLLVIHGDGDGVVPFEVSGKRVAADHDAELHVVEGGPHGLTDSHTDEVNAALLAFLAK